MKCSFPGCAEEAKDRIIYTDHYTMKVCQACSSHLQWGSGNLFRDQHGSIRSVSVNFYRSPVTTEDLDFII